MDRDILKDEPYDASDIEAVEKARKRIERVEADKAMVVTNIMATVAGRAWVYDLLVFCNVFGNPFLQGSPDGTAFNLGQQNIGKILLDAINIAAPDRYMPMLREANQRKSLS